MYIYIYIYICIYHTYYTYVYIYIYTLFLARPRGIRRQPPREVAYNIYYVTTTITMFTTYPYHY